MRRKLWGNVSELIRPDSDRAKNNTSCVFAILRFGLIAKKVFHFGGWWVGDLFLCSRCITCVVNRIFLRILFRYDCKKSWKRMQFTERTAIQKYMTRKEAFGKFLCSVRVLRWLKISQAYSKSLAKWGKMGNVIWENFKFSISWLL